MKDKARKEIWDCALNISAILSHRRFEDSISAKEASELALKILNILNKETYNAESERDPE